MSRRSTRVVLALLLVAGLTGCGDDDGSAADDPATQPATADTGSDDEATEEEATEEEATEEEATEDEATEDEATEDEATEEDATEEAPTEDAATDPAPTEGDDPAPTDPAPADAVATQDELRAAALTIDDFSEGWVETSADALPESPCGLEAAIAGRAERVQLQFEAPDRAALLQELLAARPGEGGDLFDEVGDLLASCTEEDESFSARFSEADDAPDLGERSRSFDGTVSSPDGSSFELPWVIVQQGDVVLSMAAVDLEVGGAELLETHLEQSVQRLDDSGLG